MTRAYDIVCPTPHCRTVLHHAPSMETLPLAITESVMG